MCWGSRARLRPGRPNQAGAIVVPLDAIDAMQAAAEKLAATEARIIAAAKSGGGVEAIKAAIRG